jgi:hypothetical protein
MADDAAEGVSAYAQRASALRTGMAANALTNIYGPQAADPQLWGQAQANYLAQQTDPLKVQEAQRENAADQALVGKFGPEAGNPQAYATDVATAGSANEQQRLAAYRATRMLQASTDPKTGAVDPVAFDRDIVPQADLLGLDPAHIAPLRAALTAPGGAAHLDTIAQALIGPTKITGAPIVAQGPNGQSELINRDQYGNPLATPLAPGVTPVAQQRADIQEQGVGIRQQQANTSAYRANVYAANQTYGPQAGPASAPAAAPPPAQMDAFIKKAGGIDNAIRTAPTDAYAQALTNYAASNANGSAAAGQAALAHLPPKGRALAISSATQLANQATNLQNTNQILDQVDKQITPYTAGTGSLIKDIPGTAQANLKANLATLKAQGLTSWIQSLKNQQGQTGIGRVLQAEANAAMNLYGNMEQDQSAKQLQFHAQLFRRAVNNLYAHSRAAFKAQWGTDPESAIGLPPTTQGTQGSPATKIYTYNPKTGQLE